MAFCLSRCHVELNGPATIVFAFLLLSFHSSRLVFGMSCPLSPCKVISLNSLFTLVSEIKDGKPNALCRWQRRKSILTKRLRTILIITLTPIILITLTLGLALGLGLHHTRPSSSIPSIVKPGYAQYRSSSSDGVSKWLGILFAANSAGKLRFTAPAPPQRLNGVRSAARIGRLWKLIDQAQLIVYQSPVIDA